jgi:U3 small nucleolar RNA-associated protein 18
MLEGDQASVPPPSTSHDTDTQGDSSETGGSSSSDEDADVAPTFLVSSNRKPAWTDPDDTSLQVSLAASNRLRKLRDAPDEDAVGGREYERRLRRQFERLNPTPAWATRSKSKTKLQQAKRKRLNAGSDVTSEEDNTKADDEEGSTAVDETEDFELDDVLASTHLLKSKRKAGILQKGTLNISRLRDANISALPEGSVKSVLFHPSPAVPLLAVTSSDRRVRLFNIDGHTNPHLQTLHFPELPVNTTTFHPAGRTVLLTGPRPFFCTYDLGSGAAVRSPRGLWGNAANAANGMGRGAGREDLSMETVAFSPDGSVLAVAGRGGVVHLVDWNSGGAQVVGSVKMNRPVKSLWWSRSREGKELMTMSEDAEVYIWDVGERRCVRKWKDEGAYGGRLVEGDQAGRYLAIG